MAKVELRMLDKNLVTSAHTMTRGVKAVTSSSRSAPSRASRWPSRYAWAAGIDERVKPISIPVLNTCTQNKRSPASAHRSALLLER